jgi:hypothetical protein
MLLRNRVGKQGSIYRKKNNSLVRIQCGVGCKM